MSPKAADASVRNALVEAAARLLAEAGPGALTSRRLAAEVGTSTMAVYTHFGGMERIREAVRREGFARLVADLDAVPKSADPVADLMAGGKAYFANALANPHLYRAMFMDSFGGSSGGDASGGAVVDDVGSAAFERLVVAIRRCIEAGRFERGHPVGWAIQQWSIRHGMVSLVLTGLLPAEQLLVHYADMMTRLFVGYGDSQDRAESSLRSAVPELPDLIAAIDVPPASWN